MKVQVKLARKAILSIPVQTETIPLDAFLKLANAVESGGQAKMEIQGGHVRLNGSVCLQRGKKLRQGDVVSFSGEKYQVTNEEERQ
ncbi:MAG: RNA-binding S4 domain-containing protein [Oscillospiraceae bacterium]|nr:RNA-binding S4 domain-containing protein [Oscillospiraceae bacterium]